MTPTMQTKFGPHGNCWLACIASVLGIPLESVPDVAHLYEASERGEGKSARMIIERWLMREHGLYLYQIHSGMVPTVKPIGYHIMNGPGPRGYGHAVVGFEGQIVHDPHPDGGGLMSVDTYEVFGAASAEIAKYYGEALSAEPHRIARRATRPTHGGSDADE